MVLRHSKDQAVFGILAIAFKGGAHVTCKAGGKIDATVMQCRVYALGIVVNKSKVENKTGKQYGRKAVERDTVIGRRYSHNDTQLTYTNNLTKVIILHHQVSMR